MTELDEKALRDAATLVLDEMAHPHIDEATRLARVAVETYLIRVSCKAARPTPDAEAMEREVEAFKDALERFLMAWGNRFGEGGDAIAGERYNEVVALYRKAVSR